jgi:hypothetical protein
MKPTKAKLTLGLLAGACLLASACSLPTSGILYSIENEVPIGNEQHGIPKTSVACSQLTVLGNKYLAIVGTTVFAADVPTASNGVAGAVQGWTAVPTTGLASDKLAAVSLAAGGTDLYAIYASNAGGNTVLPRLYRNGFDTTAGTWNNWVAVDLSSLNGETPQALFTTDSGTVLLETMVSTNASGNSGTYNLYRLGSGGALGARFAWTDGNSRPIVALAGPDAATLFVTGSNLYQTDVQAVAPALNNLAGPGSAIKAYTALTWDYNAATPSYYLATSTGYLAKYSGGAWASSPAVQTMTGSTTALQFSALAFVDAAFLKDKAVTGAISPSSTLIAATIGKGLFLVDLSAAAPAVIQQPSVRSGDLLWGGNYSSADLSSAGRFFRGQGSTLFIGSLTKGLWSCQFNSAYANGQTTKSGLVFTWE